MRGLPWLPARTAKSQTKAVTLARPSVDFENVLRDAVLQHAYHIAP